MTAQHQISVINRSFYRQSWEKTYLTYVSAVLSVAITVCVMQFSSILHSENEKQKIELIL